MGLTVGNSLVVPCVRVFVAVEVTSSPKMLEFALPLRDPLLPLPKIPGGKSCCEVFLGRSWGIKIKRLTIFMRTESKGCKVLTQRLELDLTATAVLLALPDGRHNERVLCAGQQAIQDNGLAAAGDVLYNPVT